MLCHQIPEERVEDVTTVEVEGVAGQAVLAVLVERSSGSAELVQGASGHVDLEGFRLQLLLPVSSVTRRPDCAFNIWPFSAMKICPKAYKLYQRELKTLPTTK